MHISFALGWSLLYASVVLASVVHAPPGTLLPRDLQLDNDASYKAGAFLPKGNNSIQYVTSSFALPQVSGDPGSKVEFWVAIDGVQCAVSLWTGVTFVIRDDGSPGYYAWYGWFPNITSIYNLSDTHWQLGDTIRLAVTAETTTSGSAAILNTNTTEFYYEELSSDGHPLCQRDAQWIVSAVSNSQGFLPLANFSRVTFKNVGAAGANQTYKPGDGVAVANIEQNGQYMTTTLLDDSSITVNYV